jgi:hypothetical protein
VATLFITLANGTPFFRVSPQGSLKLSGLNIEFGNADSSLKEPPVLIDSAGTLTLDHCAFSPLSSPTDRKGRVAQTGAPAVSVLGCSFKDLENPLQIGAFGGSKARFEDSLFVTYPQGGTPAGRAATVINRRGAARDSQDTGVDLAVERCTVVGAGLLELQGFTAAAPVKLQVQNTVGRTKWLLMCNPPAMFPAGLNWQGHQNRLAISDSAWVRDAGGVTGIPNGPDDLESWRKAVKNEADTIEGPVDLKPESFALAAPDGRPPAAGVDPAHLGPQAKPAAAK